MIPIQSLTSDLEYEFEFIKSVKRRLIEQKFLYSDSNAFKYYESIDLSYDYNEDDFTSNEFFTFVLDRLGKKRNAVIISLGCGDAQKEVNIIRSLNHHGADFKLIAVDSSKQMLEFAHQNLKDSGIEYQLIHSDIATPSFQVEIQHQTETYDTCVYTLLGGTMGNMVQTEIADTLYNIAKKNDYIWIDVLARPANAKIDQLKLFKEYLKRIDDPTEVDFYSYPLAKLGIPKENGVMQMQSMVEDSIGAQKFRFSFGIRKPITSIYRGQTIHFLPPESIKLLDIRSYHSPTLISFFDNHQLKLLRDFYKDNLGVFLFERV